MRKAGNRGGATGREQQIGGAWYGDGGVRLTAPLSPTIHLGADRILAISTRYNRSRQEADEPAVPGYPPTAQIIGVLMNAIFLDMLDQDAMSLGPLADLRPGQDGGNGARDGAEAQQTGAVPV